MTTTAPDDIDGRYAWTRLVVSVLIATIGSVGMWSVVVVLPMVQSEFGVDRADASLPYTMTMVGFALGNVWLGQIVDRAGSIFLPLVMSALALFVGYALGAMVSSIWVFALLQGLIGFGASAIGALPQGYIQNVTAMPEYRKAIGEGRLPVARGIELTAEDRLRRAIIEQIMCHMTVDLAAMQRKAGLTLDLAGEGMALDALAANGLVRIEGDVLTVPEEARPLLRSVACVFDAYLATGKAKHSRAV